MSDNLEGKTILLVDDDADLLDVMGGRCESIGLKVERAQNMLTAMMLVGKQTPDLLCIDVEMPTGSGLSFCKMLAENPVTAEIPVIVLTGRRDSTTKQTCQQLGAEYVHKSSDTWNILEPCIRELSSTRRRLDPPVIRCSHRTDTGHRAMPHITLGTSQSESLPPSLGKTVVIAEDDADLLQLLTQRFTALGCSVIATNNALEAINSINTLLPDMVCLDVNMPSGNGLSVCEMMAHDEFLKSIPVMILTGRSDEETIRRCYDMMAYYVEKNADVWARVEPVVRDVLNLDTSLLPTEEQVESNEDVDPLHETGQWSSPDELMDTVFSMLDQDPDLFQVSPEATEQDAEEHELPWVLCIDDDADFSEALKCRLEAHGVAVVRAFDGKEGYRKAFQHPANAILLDYEMPNGQGDYVLGRLKDNPATQGIPVIIVTGVKDRMLERKMMYLGADSFLNKPVPFATIRDHLAKHISILAANEEDQLLLG